jgi:hypothetical protein
MAREQQAMLLHQPVNSLCIDRRAAAGSPLALYERGDPTVAIGWSGIDKAPDFGGQLGIAFTDPRPALWASSFDALCDVRARHAQSLGDRLHREASRGAEFDSEIVLFVRARSKASARSSKPLDFGSPPTSYRRLKRGVRIDGAAVAGRL